MLSLSPVKILIIVVVAVILLGPDLPSTGDLARMARSPVEMLDRIARYDPESPDGEIPEPEEEFNPGFEEQAPDGTNRPRRPDLNAGDPGLN